MSVHVNQPLLQVYTRWWWDYNLPARYSREEGTERARLMSSEKGPRPPQQLARNTQIQRKASCFLPLICQANTQEWQVPRAVGQAGLLSSQCQQEQKLENLPGSSPVAPSELAGQGKGSSEPGGQKGGFPSPLLGEVVWTRHPRAGQPWHCLLTHAFPGILPGFREGCVRGHRLLCGAVRL